MTVAARGSAKVQSGGQNNNWLASGSGGSITLAAQRAPMFQGGGQNQKWPTSAPGGYIIPTAWGA